MESSTISNWWLRRNRLPTNLEKMIVPLIKNSAKGAKKLKPKSFAMTAEHSALHYVTHVLN